MYNATDSTWTQGSVSIGLLFAGILLGLAYTIIFAQKQHVKKKLWKNVHDIIFCICMFLLIGIALYMSSNGRISLYMVVLLAVGFYMGASAFGNVVKTVINKLVCLIKLIKVRLNKFKK